MAVALPAHLRKKGERSQTLDGSSNSSGVFGLGLPSGLVLTRGKLEQFFIEWLSASQTQTLIRTAIQKVSVGELEKVFAPGSSTGPKAPSVPSPPNSPKCSTLSSVALVPGANPPRSPVRKGQKDPIVAGDSDQLTPGYLGLSLSSATSRTPPGADVTLPIGGETTAASRDASKSRDRDRATSPVGRGGSSPQSPPPSAVTATAVSPVGRLSPVPESPPARTQGAGHFLGGPTPNSPAKVKTPTKKQSVPPFYRPAIRDAPEVLDAETIDKINEVFQPYPNGMTIDDLCNNVTVELLGLSKYCSGPLFRRLDPHNSGYVTEAALKKFWPGRLLLANSLVSFFGIVRKPSNNWIEREDLRIFLRELLNSHPGLLFLQETPEFQDRYADTVISRIFYNCDRLDMGRISLKDLWRGSIVETWRALHFEEDINKVRDLFSYEHFYVLYCKFWELDSDHDFLLDKEDLLKYDGHAFSRRAIDRIFSEVPMTFTSAVRGKMGYEDFIWFLMNDEDKTTDRSLEYWFRLVDLDGDGCIRDHEMSYFYDEQIQRLECLNHETVPFEDIMCQMTDMIDPICEGQFRLSDFKRQRKISGTFFSVLLSLNKFLAYEQRDPFVMKQDQLEHPDYTDWDRYCSAEYLRVSLEDSGEDREMEHWFENEEAC